MASGIQNLLSLGGAGAAEDAAEAQERAAQAQIEEYRRQYNQTRQDLGAYRASGGTALDMLNELMGLPAPSVTNNIDTYTQEVESLTKQREQMFAEWQRAHDAAPDFMKDSLDEMWRTQLQPKYDEMGAKIATAQGNLTQAKDRQSAYSTPTGEDISNYLQAQPGYQFRFDEGLRGVERGANARHGALGGRTLRELERYGQGFASNEYGTTLNRLQQMSNSGQNAAAQTAQFGQNTAQLVGQSLGNIGDAQAGGEMGAYSAMMNGINTLATLGATAYGAGAFSGGGSGGIPAGTMASDTGMYYNIPGYN